MLIPLKATTAKAICIFLETIRNISAHMSRLKKVEGGLPEF